MKTVELSGAALDWAVAQCLGINVRVPNAPRKLWKYLLGTVDMEVVAYHPSSDWAQGGLIIESEGCFPSRYFGCAESNPDKYQAGVGTAWVRGSTPLIAAMRSFVMSKLGEEVDIPAGLV